MLNKELLLATEGQTAGPIKLTVGNSGGSNPVFGYSKQDATVGSDIGSVSKIPTWNLNGKPVAIMSLYSYNVGTSLVFSGFTPVDASTITMTVVEKGLTATLIKTQDWIIIYDTDTVVFNSSDIGKTFTIIFDPEPTGYV